MTLRRKNHKSEEGFAILLTLMVTAALSVVALSLILITETDTKIALTSQINKENLNISEGAMQYALYVVREVPTAGYLNYPWESILPNTAFVRSDANNNGYLDNGTLSNVNNLSNPTFANVDDSGQMHVLNDLAGNPIQNIPVHAPGGTADLTTNGYYTAYVEAVQGDADWNTTGGGGTPDLKFDQYDFDRYSLLLRARTVGLYGSIKDIVMVVRVVKPDGTPYGDEPGSTQGSGTGGSSWSSTVTW